MGGAITRQRGSVALPPRGTSDARARSKSDTGSPHMRHIAVMSSQSSMTSKMNLIRTTEEAFQGMRSPSLSGLSSMLSQSSQRSQASQRSQVSQRSQQSQRSTRHSSVRESRASSTSSFKAFKFDMLEPDPGSMHALVDSAFRVKAYKWILDQVGRKAQAALEVHQGYIDEDETEGELKLFAGGCVVDAARHRIVPMGLDAVGSAMWATLTSSIDTDQWHCLEKVSESMCYAQVDVVNGIGDDESLVLNILVQKVTTPDRFVIVMRTVAEDHVYPLPKQSITFIVGSFSIERLPHHKCVLASTGHYVKRLEFEVFSAAARRGKAIRTL
ncbi:hypothetical protein Ae201684P_017040 [Aphanomyces euteiches]|nr:hypothetical protein Ae201684P_017040 [Aphanomyces euteiches]